MYFPTKCLCGGGMRGAGQGERSSRVFSAAEPSSSPRPVLFSLTSRLHSQELWGLERGQRYVARCESKENRTVSPEALCPVLASLPAHRDRTPSQAGYPLPPPVLKVCPHPSAHSPFSGARQLQVQRSTLFHLWDHGRQRVRCREAQIPSPRQLRSPERGRDFFKAKDQARADLGWRPGFLALSPVCFSPRHAAS